MLVEAATSMICPVRRAVPRNRLETTGWTVAVLRNRLGRVALVAVAALFALASAAPTANAAPARYEGSSADGGVAFFTTAEQLVPGDTDNEEDVFQRSKDTALGEYVTRKVTTGPTGGNDAYDALYNGASADGSRVFFSTRESLVAEDSDDSSDIYMREIGTNATTLVSRGDASCAASGCGNAALDASFVAGGVVPSGARVFFATKEGLNTADGDSSFDIYMRDIEAGTTTLVSRGDASCAASGCGDGLLPAIFKEASTTGTKVFFTSSEGLVAGDEDGLDDIYQRDLGSETTSLVSVAGVCPTDLPPGQNCEPNYGGASNDGSHVFFETNDRVSAGDLDSSQDVYDWSGGVPALASIGLGTGNGPHNATYAGGSASGAVVYLETGESLDATADTDARQDVYARSGGTTTLVSAGSPACAPGCGNGDFPASFEWASPDGSSSAVIFTTAEPLDPIADTDSSQDVYERAGAATTLVSIGSSGGNGPGNAGFADASSDGLHLLFVTDEALVSADTDAVQDIYERSGGATSLVSTGSIGGNGPFPTKRLGISSDGSAVFFETSERLTVDDDFAAEDDVYSRSGGVTLLVSVANDPELELGPAPPSLTGTDPASPGESTTPKILGYQAEADATIKIYTTSDCSEEPVAWGTAGELASPGISVTVAPGSTTSFRATAEAEGFVSACSSAIAYTQKAAPPPPPPPPPPGEESGTGTGETGSGSTGTGGTGSSSTGTQTKTHDGGIAYVAPESRITFGPAFKTRKRRAVFQFTDATGQPGTSFLCKINRRKWRACSSPTRLRKLKLGRHVFKVKGVNAVGSWEETPVKRAFKVVR